MSTPSDPDLVARVAELERQVNALKARLVVLEKVLAPREEHPVDRTVVREKVTYDWQS